MTLVLPNEEELATTMMALSGRERQVEAILRNRHMGAENRHCDA